MTHPIYRYHFFLVFFVLFALIGTAAVLWWPPILWALVLVLPLFCIGVYDVTQTGHAVLRNWPVIGHVRYLLEAIRPELQQYFEENIPWAVYDGSDP